MVDPFLDGHPSGPVTGQVAADHLSGYPIPSTLKREVFVKWLRCDRPHFFCHFSLSPLASRRHFLFFFAPLLTEAYNKMVKAKKIQTKKKATEELAVRDFTVNLHKRLHGMYVS